MSPTPPSPAPEDRPPPAPRPEQLASPPGSKDSQEPDEPTPPEVGTEKEPPKDLEKVPIQLPPFEELEGFVWDDEYNDLFKSLASTGLASSSQLIPTQYSTLFRILIYRLRYAVQGYLDKGEDVLFDARQEPGASNGWIWESKEVERAVGKVKEALDEFDRPEAWVGKDDQGLGGLAEAPFTLQRLAELLIPLEEGKRIHPHYATLPKYLRAILKVLAVTSSLAAFPVDTYSLISLASNAASEGTLTNGGASASPSPTSMRPRRHSTSTPVTPLLTPIPWLISDGDIEATQRLREPSPASLFLNGSSPPPTHALTLPNASQPPLSNPLSPPSLMTGQRALSPPGRIDELDPGLGTAEEMEGGPIAIGSQALSPRVGPVGTRDAEDVEMKALDPTEREANSKDGDKMDVDS